MMKSLSGGTTSIESPKGAVNVLRGTNLHAVEQPSPLYCNITPQHGSLRCTSNNLTDIKQNV